MNCARYREAASARLDGEPLGLSAAALEHHLATCLDCARWLATAERAGRSLRISATVPPDLSAQILTTVVLPHRRLARRERLVRSGLLVLGFIQWALAMPALFGQNMAEHAMAMGTHAAHESAAWNLAMGASFLAVAVKPARSSGTLPILATFVGVLSVLSIPDLVSGQVEPARLASHLGVLAGLVLVALLSRAQKLPSPSMTASEPVPARAAKRPGKRGAA